MPLRGKLNNNVGNTRAKFCVHPCIRRSGTQNKVEVLILGVRGFEASTSSQHVTPMQAERMANCPQTWALCRRKSALKRKRERTSKFGLVGNSRIFWCKTLDCTRVWGCRVPQGSATPPSWALILRTCSACLPLLMPSSGSSRQLLCKAFRQLPNSCPRGTPKF